MTLKREFHELHELPFLIVYAFARLLLVYFFMKMNTLLFLEIDECRTPLFEIFKFVFHDDVHQKVMM
jgi:hypothetical protein